MSVPEEKVIQPTQIITKTPSSFWQYLISFGPGIVMVLSWLGAGDLVDMSVSGAHYGYNLMWGLVLALVLRYILVNVISKYALCNVHQETIFQGYKRLYKYLPLFLGVASLFLAHFYAAIFLKGLEKLSGNLAR
ncbi:hypothetical protein CVD25_03585 [Bacillus canaveralius]|uniref:Mn2+/Fe2+ transporter n=1 Tax=Bacillus canaveralius TaxID=1403243 RepID=A0A2N5GSE3_9BACI|nr:hypothetical protein [Bacillus canaveralius]PLR86559.1 hypothetical protein CU635_01180 [Bacillus canaveralius]PLS00330.1 hypothetical protein CVD25_03585 [Bacillus canaveralius]